MEQSGPLSSEYVISTSKTLLSRGSDDGSQEYLYHSSKGPNPDLNTLVYLKSDFNFSREINSDLLLKPLEFIQDNKELVVKKEYFDGVPLSDLVSEREFTVKEVLKISIQLATLIDQAHKKAIVLRELNPSIVLVNENTLSIKLALAGSASKLSKERALNIGNFQSAEQLRFIAPEQSGRTGRNVDFRSDFYALGCIVYSLLIGSPPFNFSSARRLVHSHIAIQPKPISEFRPNVPIVFQEIVQKLLNKNPEDRYQNASGLLYDLTLCTDENVAMDNEQLLGSKDYTTRLLLSEKIYGREKELDQLNKTFKRISKGLSELVLVKGYSGIGKTRLIGEFEKTIIKHDGIYAAGKFDQFKRDMPFLAVIQAFNDLVHNLIADEGDRIQKWRGQINSQLRGIGGAILEHIPALEMIIGPQDPLYPLSAAASKNRLFSCFYSILSVLDKDQIAVTIFLDDLQWIDSGSLELVQYILKSDLKNILLIGAFRDNEVSPSHPLSIAIEGLEEELPKRINFLKIRELKQEDVLAFISDSLIQPTEEVFDLSNIITEKSGGNPFFFKQLIQELYRDNIISYDENQLKWHWDMSKIVSHKITDNVVDLLISRVSLESNSLKHCLCQAACIGNQFDMKTLHVVSSLDNEALAVILTKAIDEGYVYSSIPWSADILDKKLTALASREEEVIFRFQHDKIQQAYYSLIPEEKLQETHLKIGRILWDNRNDEDQAEDLFDLLNHVNIAAALLTDPSEISRLAKLNLKAGNRALKSNALEPARLYYNNGIQLVGDQTNSQVYKELLIATSECEYLNGNHEKSEKLFDEALVKAENNLDKADVLSRKMALYENTQQHLNAIQAAVEGLALLGVVLPEDPSFDDVLLEKERFLKLLDERSIHSLLDLPLMKSPEQQLASKFLMNLFGPAYLVARPMLIAWSSLRMVAIAIEHGNCFESAFGYALYGFMSSVTFADYAHGYDYAKVGIDLNERLADNSLRSRVLVMAVGCTAHWREPYEKIWKRMYSAYQSGVEANDIIWAGYSITHYNRAIVFSSEMLPSALKKLKSVVHFTRQIQSDISTQQLLAWIRMIENLLLVGQNEEEYGEFVDEQVHFEHAVQLSDAGIPLALANYYIAQGMRALILNDFNKAVELFDKAHPISVSVYGLEEWAELHFLIPLAQLMKASLEGSLKKDVANQINEGLDQLKSWASLAPENYASKYHLILALLHALNGQGQESEKMFLTALQSATEAKLHYVIGLINEQWANYLTQLGNVGEAEGRIKHAYLSYRDWGAKEKLRSMENEHPFLKKDFTSSDQETHHNELNKAIDLESVFMASMSIAGERNSSAIVNNLLEIVVENAGAQKATFVTVEEGALHLVADIEIERSPKIEFHNESLSSTTKLPRSIIRAVNSGQEAIIISDTHLDHDFMKDPYFRKGKARSILSSPIIHKQEVRGIIYLENTLSAYAFTEDHLRTLQMLSGQIAISLENAGLVERLEEKVAARTRTVEAQKAIIEEEKKKSESLLLNILPTDIANELKRKGSYQPRTYDDATIMFTDFKDFTAFTRQNNANEIVEYLDSCYKSFDDIVKRNGIEKIKTIGDSYMCASGIPTHYKDHAARMVETSLELISFLEEFNSQRITEGKLYCEMRIGIHTGPIIAGVVGHHKFAYDIWGESVNTASRMESASEVGRINVSATTYERIKDRFPCTHRGKIEVKNLGAINMYFVD